MLVCCVTWINGQENQIQTGSKDKKKIELRPNSREYGPVKRDNFHHRIDRKQNKAIYLKKKALIQQKRVLLRKNKQQIKRQQVIKRRQTIIQRRRALRK
jgi:methionine aminopeptidase